MPRNNDSSRRGSTLAAAVAKPQRRDRFDELALFYAECFLGEEQLDRSLRRASRDTESPPPVAETRESPDRRDGLRPPIDGLRRPA